MSGAVDAIRIAVWSSPCDNKFATADCSSELSSGSGTMTSPL